MMHRAPIKYFLVVIAAFILLIFSQQSVWGNIFQKGPSLTLAQDLDPNFQPTGSEPLNPSFPSDSNDPNFQPTGSEPLNPSGSSSSSDPNFQPTGSEPLNPSSGGSSSGGGSAPCPAQGCPGGDNPPPTPASCPESREQYPQCGATVGLENFPATDTIMVTRVKDCRGNIIRYETQNLGNLGQCQQATTTTTPPPAPAPAAPPQQPSAPSCPTDIKTCPDGTGVSRNPGDGCNFFACPAQPAQPTQSRSVCPGPGQAGTRLLCNQWAYDNCSVTERDSNGNATKYHCVFSGNDNCVGDISCQQTTSAPVCTPRTTQESSCVGNQLCTFNNNRASDCTTSRTGPFNCQLIAGECGFNPGSTCTVATANQSICVNAQLCTVTLTRNTDCTISRSGPFNCQNSAQCGFSTPPGVGGPSAPVNIVNTNNNTNTVTVSNPPAVAQSFGNVGVGTTVYTQGVQYATTLPKTGLPLLAWAAGAFLPAGIGLRRFKKIKKELDGDGSFLWEEREYKRA